MRAHLRRLTHLDYRLFRALALGWMALIFYLSSRPFIPVPGLFEDQDKFMHFGAYAALGVFVAGGWRKAGVRLPGRDAALAALVVVLYGISDEFHQSFVPGRQVSLGDLIADALGGLFGAWLIYRARVRAVL